MSYTPYTWQSGDTVTASRLNNIEQGVANAGGLLIVHDVDGTLDKTWQEIKDAGFAILNIEDDVGILCNTNYDHTGYFLTFACILPTGMGFDDPMLYTASTANGYPVLQD